METIQKSRKMYIRPMVVDHKPIRFETSQSWNRGRGIVSSDPGNSDGKHYKHDPYHPKKPGTPPGQERH